MPSSQLLTRRLFFLEPTFEQPISFVSHKYFCVWMISTNYNFFDLRRGHLSPVAILIVNYAYRIQSRQWTVTALRWRPGSRDCEHCSGRREIEDTDSRVERSRSSENCFPISEPLNWNCNCRLPSCKMKINYQPQAGDNSQSILTAKCGYFLALGPPFFTQNITWSQYRA